MTDMLKKICPEAGIQVAANGIVSAKTNFCSKADLLSSCKCICAAISSTKTIDVVVQADLSQWGGGRTDDANPDDTVNGVGSNETVNIENQNRWRLDKKDGAGNWIDDPDWIILAHELCGHAVPGTKGTHPEWRPGKPGYKADWHNDAIDKENAVRNDRGVPERPYNANVVKK